MPQYRATDRPRRYKRSCLGVLGVRVQRRCRQGFISHSLSVKSVLFSIPDPLCLAFTTSGEGEEPFNGFKNESPDINLSTVIRRNSFFRTVDVRISVQAGGSARSRSRDKLSKCSRTLKDGDIWEFRVIRTNHKWVLAEPTTDATEKIFFSIIRQVWQVIAAPFPC